jgi:DNA-binding NarL/FixJ family response regulator
LGSLQMRILIADDSAPHRRFLRLSLEAHPDWNVCAEARNGSKAIFLAKECKPDIVVLDFVMPVMNGLYAAREISRALPGVPILLHTSHEACELEAEAKRSGVTQVVCKSDPSLLIAEIEKAIAQPRPQPALPVVTEPRLDHPPVLKHAA